MSNTQARFSGIHDAIERDRLVNPREVVVAGKDAEGPQVQHREAAPRREWEPWVTIGIGLSVMMIAAFF